MECFRRTSFNRTLVDWNVSSVIDTELHVLWRGSILISPLADFVSGVKGHDGMFREASSFNQPIAIWNGQ
jgi:hypothetical protein